MKRILLISAVLFMTMTVLAGCLQPAPTVQPWHFTFNTLTPLAGETLPAVESHGVKTTTIYAQPNVTPTPNSPRIMPTLRKDPVEYTVQQGDSLAMIARTFGVDLNALQEENQISDPNLLEIGSSLVVPAVDPNLKAVDFKIIPDSELVYSPSSLNFDVTEFMAQFSGYLTNLDYSEDVVAKVAREYSINPRILLTLLEYQTGWLTSDNTSLEAGTPAPADAWQSNLYSVLGTIAGNLNWGFYHWMDNEIGYFILKDGSYIPASATINAGTAAVEYWAGTVFTKDEWLTATSEQGIYKLYKQFFGNPFQYSIEDLFPQDLTQPEMILPFQPGVAWSFTGGPHSGWGQGSAWAAVDFAPPGSPLGCVVSLDWVTAVADGVIVRNESGTVIQDLDGDANEQTGWTILYLHVSSWQQIQAGTKVKAGDLIGHASCEGGVASGAHLHIARRYNGVWVDAAGSIPFTMDGYSTEGMENEYDGFLVKNGEYIEAYAYYRPESLVMR